MPGKDRVISRAGEMAREASETYELVTRNNDKGQGDEQSSRDGKGSV
jgi:hypothetical protein